ncbi:HNH endonuclease [Pseudanabaena sp. UWO310]|uniref:HNH endonuclease n=1 Tax=Pseudanabaena sp. UWO310 TaxID=2480795 RepID=UPI001157F139|nr:HNH endonuclease [Pseudanabaena sp. UWO310]TYQ28800.1 hypothetical protein PseudUWO310_13575 [Pseudanabaena sp. UWO310]
MKKLSQGQKLERPKNLDKRVFFCDEFKGVDFLRKHDLLWLYIIKKGGTSKFQWVLEFDVLESGNTGGSVAFTKHEFTQIAQICESRNFDWNFRISSSYPSLILYRYSELDSVIEVANKLADFTYRLHYDQKRRTLIDEIYKASHQSDNQELVLRINGKKNGQFRLITDQELKLEILFFKNGRISTRREVNSAIAYETGYTRDKAIKESNPNRKDGILLINHHIKKSEFHATDWNTFCLTVDKRIFTKSGEPINYVYKEDVEQIHLELQEENNNSFDVVQQNLFPDEVAQSINDLGVNKSFREGATSQVSVNAYERNHQAREKCIDHYGTSCVVCGFNFGKAFGELGDGFIHVHHLKPISEIREEYEINPVEDMRPVCPNCHAMIHRRIPLLSIEEVREVLQNNFDRNNV